MSERKVYVVPEHKEPDHSIKKRKDALWCPYEGKWQRFTSKDGGYRRCVGCNISNEDYWVKMSNGLWEMPKKKGR